jgi:CheY-like chemotaxis protein
MRHAMEKQPTALSQKMGNYSYLFVEHYTINREQNRRIFERKKQLEGDVTQDGLKALLLTERYAYDIIFMDLAISINMEHDRENQAAYSMP